MPMKRVIEPGIDQCSWFLNCPNDATTMVPHPILGDVPCCDRCAAFAQDDRDPTFDKPENPGDALGPCGCVDYHMADCDGQPAMTKDDYLDLYAGSYPDDWPDDEGGY